MTEAGTTRTLVIEREMPHSPEKIWRALTEGQLIEEWLLKNDFKPVVGHRFQFRREPMPNWNGIIDCEVLEVEPTSRLSYGWGSMGLETVVTWILTRVDHGTRLRLVHSGFVLPRNDTAYRNMSEGWTKVVERLDLLVGGQEVPPTRH